MTANPIPTVGVVVIRDTSVLLVKHLSHGGHVTGSYGLPAGRLEENESEAEGAKRELKEETGLDAELVDLIEFPNNYYTANISRNDGTVKRMSWTVFIAKQIRGELQNSEDTIPLWVSIDQIANLSLVPNVENAINAALLYMNENSSS